MRLCTKNGIGVAQGGYTCSSPLCHLPPPNLSCHLYQSHTPSTQRRCFMRCSVIFLCCAPVPSHSVEYCQNQDHIQCICLLAINLYLSLEESHQDSTTTHYSNRCIISGLSNHINMHNHKHLTTDNEVRQYEATRYYRVHAAEKENHDLQQKESQYDMLYSSHTRPPEDQCTYLTFLSSPVGHLSTIDYILYVTEEANFNSLTPL